MRSATVLAGLLAGAGAHVLRRTDQCYALDGPSCTGFSIGQKDTGKQVCTRVSGSNLVVDYPAVNGYPYSEVHVYLGSSPPSTHAPGQFPYTSNNGYCKVASDKSTATCTIPMGDFASCNGKYYIATHSAQGVETGWGQGPCISKSCKPWAMYWGPITVKCPPCPTTKPSATTTATTPTTTKYSTTKDTTTKDKDTTTKMDTTTKDKDTTKMDTTTKDKDSTTKDTSTTPTTTKKDTTTSDTMTTPMTTTKKDTMTTPMTTTKKDTTTKDKDTTTKMDTTTKDKDTTTKMDTTTKDKDTTTKMDTTTKDKDTTTKKDSTTKMCESTTTPAPITTTSDCPKETSSKSQTTYYETSYTTTVKTDVYTKTSDVYDYYTITSMCEATQTQAPIKYTTTCAAY